jgi:Tol biopolymer transport system component
VRAAPWAIVLTGVMTPGAQAAYGPGADAASANGARLGGAQSDQPALSADGRYVVFTTSAPELLGAPADPTEAYTNGIVRRDLLTGAVALVAPPRTVRRSDGAEVYTGATAAGASISADGRAVAFRSAVALTGDDRNTGTDVYVRDMDRPVTDDGAYQLASALDGTTDGPTYAGAAGDGARTGTRGYGISDDGATVVFSTSATSNLPGGGAADVPAGQVFVRDLATQRTELVTQATAGGGPVPRGRVVDPQPVLSGDGSTVAWADPDAGAQTRLLPGEPGPVVAYLWRDLRAAVPTTRRIAGASDLDDPACASDTPFVSGPAASGPCDGPFVEGEAGTDTALRPLSISGDGRRLLFRSDASQRPFDPTLARGGSVYVADMSPGVSRKAGVRRILSIPGTTASATVGEAIMSRDAQRVLFSSSARIFDGGAPLGDFPTVTQGAGLVNLYVLDRAAGTIQRATSGFDGSDFHGDLVDPEDPGTFGDPGASALTADADLTVLAFSAQDGNLFPGDANGVRDVEVVRGTPGLTAVAGAPTALPAPAVAPLPMIWPAPIPAPKAVHPVFGFPTIGRDGIARITVRVPAQGTLTATATAKHRLTVARVTSRPKHASSVVLKLKASAVAARALRSAALRVTASVRYRPAAGASTAASRTYTLRRTKAKKK